MDDVDLASELIELETELARRARAVTGPAHYESCRDCGEPLDEPVLRSAGFCDRFCRDRFEIAERLKKITGRR